MKYIQSFEDFKPINEAEASELKMLLESIPADYNEFAELFETANLTLTADGIKKRKDGVGVFFVNINDKKYGYVESPIAKLKIEEVAEKFAKIMKYSAGKALVWLKKNTALAVRPKDTFEESEG